MKYSRRVSALCLALFCFGSVDALSYAPSCTEGSPALDLPLNFSKLLYAIDTGSVVDKIVQYFKDRECDYDETTFKHTFGGIFEMTMEKLSNDDFFSILSRIEEACIKNDSIKLEFASERLRQLHGVLIQKWPGMRDTSDKSFLEKNLPESGRFREAQGRLVQEEIALIRRKLDSVPYGTCPWPSVDSLGSTFHYASFTPGPREVLAQEVTSILTDARFSPAKKMNFAATFASLPINEAHDVFARFFDGVAMNLEPYRKEDVLQFLNNGKFAFPEQYSKVLDAAKASSYRDPDLAYMAEGVSLNVSPERLAADNYDPNSEQMDWITRAIHDSRISNEFFLSLLKKLLDPEHKTENLKFILSEIDRRKILTLKVSRELFESEIFSGLSEEDLAHVLGPWILKHLQSDVAADTKAKLLALMSKQNIKALIQSDPDGFLKSLCDLERARSDFEIEDIVRRGYLEIENGLSLRSTAFQLVKEIQEKPTLRGYSSQIAGIALNTNYHFQSEDVRPEAERKKTIDYANSILDDPQSSPSLKALAVWAAAEADPAKHLRKKSEAGYMWLTETDAKDTDENRFRFYFLMSLSKSANYYDAVFGKVVPDFYLDQAKNAEKSGSTKLKSGWLLAYLKNVSQSDSKEDWNPEALAPIVRSAIQSEEEFLVLDGAYLQAMQIALTGKEFPQPQVEPVQKGRKPRARAPLSLDPKIPAEDRSGYQTLLKRCKEFNLEKNGDVTPREAREFIRSQINNNSPFFSLFSAVLF